MLSYMYRMRRVHPYLMSTVLKFLNSIFKFNTEQGLILDVNRSSLISKKDNAEQRFVQPSSAACALERILHS
jgi:hypothetical protein